MPLASNNVTSTNYNQGPTTKETWNIIKKMCDLESSIKLSQQGKESSPHSFICIYLHVNLHFVLKLCSFPKRKSYIWFDEMYGISTSRFTFDSPNLISRYHVKSLCVKSPLGGNWIEASTPSKILLFSSKHLKDFDIPCFSSSSFHLLLHTKLQNT